MNPRIIYVGAFGYSQRGPYAAKAAYDDLIQGAAGLPWLLREAGARVAALRAGDRRRPLGGPARGERGERGAVRAREDRQGPARGRADVREPAADRCSASTWAATPSCRSSAKRGYRRMLSQVPPALRDARTATSARSIYNDKHWKAFFEHDRPPGHAARTRASPRRRRAARTSTRSTASSPTRCSKRTTAEWLAALERADIPVQRMNSLEDILRDPHLAAIGYFSASSIPSEGRSARMKVPSEWSETRPEYRRPRRAWASTRARCCAKRATADAQIDGTLATSGAARL